MYTPCVSGVVNTQVFFCVEVFVRHVHTGQTIFTLKFNYWQDDIYVNV